MSSGKIIVIGAGAAGLMAACAASDCGADAAVMEHNEKAGRKLFITGKGRCNYSNACETRDFFDHVVHNPKFLFSAVYGFDQKSMTDFLNENGCPTKVERGLRCFPASDHAFDVTDALVRHLKRNGVRIHLNTDVKRILIRDSGNPDAADPRPSAAGVETEDGRIIPADAVIVATGGCSYPSTGSTGDGYRFAAALGLAVVPQHPSLVPFITEEQWPAELQGLSLRNVAVRMERITPSAQGSPEENPSGEKQHKKRSRQPKPVYEGFGELLFTHFGVSGPLVLSASCHSDFAADPQGYRMLIDLKPALDLEELTARLHREFSAAPDRELSNVLRALMPAHLAEIVSLQFAGTEQERAHRPVRMMNEQEVRQLAAFLKAVPLHITGTRGFNEAIVTGGGVSVKEINPSTMESRRIRGLYFAGEVLDVDAYTGGFNLQIAWSTGHLAGESAAHGL